MKMKKNKRKQSKHWQRYVNVGVQSLYHGVFTTCRCHNASSYNSEQKALIISLLTSRKLVKTPGTVTVKLRLFPCWKGNAKSDSSSFSSMLIKDNVGEHGLSARSSYMIDTNDENYIDNPSSHNVS